MKIYLMNCLVFIVMFLSLSFPIKSFFKVLDISFIELININPALVSYN